MHKGWALGKFKKTLIDVNAPYREIKRPADSFFETPMTIMFTSSLRVPTFTL